MATAIWEGQAAAVAQVDTITVALTWAGADTVTVTINDRDLTLTVGTDTSVTAVATAITEMWNGTAQTGTGDHTFSETGNDVPEMSQITATSAIGVVTLTADTAGVPFTMTATEVTAGNGTATETTATTSSGPNDFSTGDNWSTGVVPANSEPVVFENSSVDCLYGLNQSNTIASVTIKASYTGNIGLPRWNDTGYVEYRTMALACSTAITAITIGQGEGDGSGRIKLAPGALTAALSIDVYKTGTRAETGIPCVLLTSGAQTDDTTLNVNKGDVGVAFFSGETAVVDIVNVGYQSQVLSDSDLVLGSGVTPLTTVNVIGGQTEIRGATVTLNQSAGEVTTSEDVTVTTANIRGGTLFYNSSGTAGTISVLGGATLDCRRDSRERSLSEPLKLYSGANVFDPNSTLDIAANGVDFVECDLNDVFAQFGKHRTWSSP